MKNDKHNNNFTTESSDNTINSLAEFTTIESVALTDEEQPPGEITPPNYKLKLRPTTWTALLLMSIVGIVAVTLHFKQNHSTANEEAVPETIVAYSELDEDEEEEHKVEPVNKNFSNNIKFIAENCAQMVTRTNSFAVFEHGTCVLIIEPLNDPVAIAKSSLKILFDPGIEFQVKKLINNNYLVIFDEYLFYWFSAETIAENKDAMMQDPRLARKINDSARINTHTDFEIRIGKLARLNLKADTNQLAIKKIIRAKQNLKEDTSPVPTFTVPE